MAIAPTKNTAFATPNVTKWVLTDVDGVGKPVNKSKSPDKTIQVNGTFNSGTITFQGTNQDAIRDTSPIIWNTLHNPQGVALTFTAAGLEAVAENPLFVRAVLTGTVGAASVVVIMVANGRNG